jgi:DNA-binding NtrC family response regulator
MRSPPLSKSSILVVEGKDRAASDVRSALMRLGAQVHVVGNADAGLMIVNRKRLHGAIIDCVTDSAALPLSTELTLSGVPYMFYGGRSSAAADDAAAGIAKLVAFDFDGAVPARRLPTTGSGDWRAL